MARFGLAATRRALVARELLLHRQGEALARAIARELWVRTRARLVRFHAGSPPRAGTAGHQPESVSRGPSLSRRRAAQRRQTPSPGPRFLVFKIGKEGI